MDTTRLKSLGFRLDSESCRDVHGQVLGPAGAAKSTVACSTWNASSQSAEPFGWRCGTEFDHIVRRRPRAHPFKRLTIFRDSAGSVRNPSGHISLYRLPF